MMKLIIKVALLCLLVSCSKNKKDDVILIPLTEAITSVDPAQAGNTINAEIVAQVYEPLYQYSYLTRPYKLEPLLAKDMPSISDDGKTYTIDIKENIYYYQHNTEEKRELTAQDFVSGIKRLALLSTKSTGWWLFEGKILGLDAFRKEAKSDLSNFESIKVQGLQALNKYRLQIKLTKKFPQIIYSLAMIYSAPIPYDIVLGNKNNLEEVMYGTGPYLASSIKKNSLVKFVKNTAYQHNRYPSNGTRKSIESGHLSDKNKQLPLNSGLEFKVIKESQTRWLNFLKEKVDFFILTKDHFQTALNEENKLKKKYKTDKINLTVSSTLTYWWLSFNMDDSLIGKNKNLRYAIAHAFDVEKYIQMFTNNIGLQANSLFPPSVEGHDIGRKNTFTFNLDKAKSYLAKAGFPEGKGMPTLNFDTRGSSVTVRNMAEFFKIQMKKVGIKVKVHVNSFGDFLKKARQNQLQVWQGGWAMDYPDPENILALLQSKNVSPGPNSANIRNKKIDLLIEQYLKNPKKKTLREIEDIFSKELPWALLYYSRNYVLFNNRVQNFMPSDLIYNFYKYLKVKD